MARNKNTALSRVADLGDAETASILLNAGAHVNHRNAADRSPLYLAVNNKPCQEQYEAMVKILIAHKADVDEAYLPPKWKEFRHLLRHSGISPDTVAAQGRTRSESLSVAMRRISTTRRDSGADTLSLADPARTSSGSTVASTSAGSVTSLGQRLNPKSWARRKKSGSGDMVPS
jgi:ankyrin repeat protein